MYRNADLRKKSVQWSSCICCIFRISPGCHRKGYALERERRSGALDCSVSADRSDRCGKKLRCRCYPYQQPVRKGRRRLYTGDKVWTEPSSENARGYGLCSQSSVRSQAQRASSGRDLQSVQIYLRKCG